MINRTIRSIIYIVGLITASTAAMASTSFDTHFVELDTSRMVHTSDSNYAIYHNGFPSNWRSVSINGDEVNIATNDNQSIMKRLSQLSKDEKNSLDTIRTTLTSVIKTGPFNVKSQTGLCRLTTFDRYGGSSSMGSSGSSSSTSSLSASSSSSSSSSSGGGTSISRTGPNAFIISKQNFPFNWLRLFVNDDFVTAAYRDGRVMMLPQSLMRPEERAKLVEIRAEVDQSTKAAETMTKSFSKSFSSPMDFVNKALGGIFGR